jgi:hypothetical protein
MKRYQCVQKIFLFYCLTLCTIPYKIFSRSFRSSRYLYSQSQSSHRDGHISATCNATCNCSLTVRCTVQVHYCYRVGTRLLLVLNIKSLSMNRPDRRRLLGLVAFFTFCFVLLCFAAVLPSLLWMNAKSLGFDLLLCW